MRYGATALPNWANAVRTAARAAFAETAVSLDRSARALKAVASVQAWFRGGLNKALAPLEENSRTEEGEAA
jgi:hypothetical protein